jgi:Cu-Zn family superoxide dismutase
MTLTRKCFVSTASFAALVVGLAALGTSRAQTPESHGVMKGPSSSVTKAVAVLHATKKGGNASGKVVFTKTAGGVRVEADIQGLTPGPHGFHIHEFGDTSSDEGMSTGGHFDPLGTAHHGDRTAGKRHVGDLGNIEADSSGHAKLDIVDPALGFHGVTSIIGRGLVVHAKPDDLKSQPAGAAGDRVAVGAIGIAKSMAPEAKAK